MKAGPMVWYGLRWPREVTSEQVAQVFRLLATVAGTPVVVEAVGQHGSVTHRLALPSGQTGVVNQLRAAVPGLAVEVSPQRAVQTMNRAVELRLSTRQRPLRTDDPANVSRALLTALAHVGHGEAVGLQWVLGRPLIPMAVPNQLDSLSHESWLGALLAAPFGAPRPVDGELRNALRVKQAEPGWRMVGRPSSLPEHTGRLPAKNRYSARLGRGAERQSHRSGSSESSGSGRSPFG